MRDSTRSASPCPAFDAVPVEIRERDDLGIGPKLLYGLLNSAANTDRQPTQADLASALCVSVRSIIRWTKDLVIVGLLAVRKRGQGLAQLYTLLGARVLRRARWSRPDVTTGQQERRHLFKEDRKRGQNVYRPDLSRYLQSRHGPLVPR